MPNWLVCILIFISGYLFPYVVTVIDLGIQWISNKATLNATKVQQEINEINQEMEVLEPCIGFRVDNADEQDEDYQEENKINNIGFR